MTNDNSTPDDVEGLIDEILALDSEGTAGPWFDDAAVSGDGSVVMSEDTGLRVAHLPKTRNVHNHSSDARLIAHYRVAAPRVARLLREARVGVEYRAGLPSVEDVRAHEARGGWWQIRDFRHPDPDLRFIWLIVEGGIVCDAHDSDERPFCPCRDDRMRPCSPDGDALPWPTKGEEPSR